MNVRLRFLHRQTEVKQKKQHTRLVSCYTWRTCRWRRPRENSCPAIQTGSGNCLGLASGKEDREGTEYFKHYFERSALFCFRKKLLSLMNEGSSPILKHIHLPSMLLGTPVYTWCQSRGSSVIKKNKSRRYGSRATVNVLFIYQNEEKVWPLWLVTDLWISARWAGLSIL